MLDYISLCSLAVWESAAYIAKLREQGSIIFPPEEKMFKAFFLTPKENVKVVVLGQDPYHQPGQANGLAFSVPRSVPAPPSLRNVFKELKDEGFDRTDTDLSDWAEQGVLLLNTALSVEQGRPGMHCAIWKEFAQFLIQEIAEVDRPIVWMLWGHHAKEYEKYIDASKHLVLTSSHPSPLGAYRGFFGCDHFRKANEWLTEHGLTPIRWSDRASCENNDAMSSLL